MFGLIEPFYEASSASIDAGQIWRDQPIYMPPRHGIKIDRVDPQDDRELGLKIVGRTQDTFDHMPIKSLGLPSSEALVAARAKWERPVIVLGGSNAQELTPAKTDHADIVMAVPVYGADQYDEHTRKRIAGYDFANAFYLPEDKSLKFDEGFARLDHVQAVHRGHLRRHRGFKLAPDALDALIEWLFMFMTGRIDPSSVLLEFRKQSLG